MIDREVGNGSTWLVEFYAPWCKHCQALQPVLEAAARTLRDTAGERSHVCFGKVDVTTPGGISLGMRFMISGYPCTQYSLYTSAIARFTLPIWSGADIVLVTESANVRVYEQIKGSRTEQAIVQWVREGFKKVEPRTISPMAPW